MSRFLCRPPFQTLIRFVVLSVFTFSLVLGWTLLGWTPPAQSQLPSLPINADNHSFNPPEGVSRHGEYETAPIKSPLDGKDLFEVIAVAIKVRTD